MYKFVLIGNDAYRLPLTKRVVERGEIFSTGEKEAEKIRRVGKFQELEDDVEEEEDTFGGMFATPSTALSTVPADWKGLTILILCYGGIGDCLIASSITCALKKKPCHVTFATGQNALGFCELLSEPDEVMDLQKTNASGFQSKFDVVLRCSGYALAGPKHIIDMDFYEACFKKIDFLEQPIIVPQFSLKRQSNAVRSRLRMTGASTQDMIAVHVDPTALHRKWPLHFWASLFIKLGEQGKTILLLGLPNETFDEIVNVVNCTDMDISDQLNICNATKYFVGVDSCWAHIAGLLRKDGLVLFGPSVPENLISKYEGLQSIQANDEVCKHRNFHSHSRDGEICNCIRELSPEKVYNTIKKHLYPEIDRQRIKFTKKIELPKDIINRNIRLVFVFPHVILGGGETSSLELCKHLQKYFDLDILAMRTYTPNNHIIDELDALDAKYVKSSSEIARVIKNCDVVLWYGMNTKVIDALRNLEKRPYSMRVCHTHFEVEAEGFVQKYGGEQGYIDDSICVSPVKAKQMNAFTIPNPINVERFKNAVRPVKRGNTMGWIGRLDDNKNIVWLLKQVASTNHDLIIQGLPELYTEDHLRVICKREGIENRVKYYSGDVVKFYEDIDVLILPSKMEALPMVVLEAGYCGVPSIVTDVGGTKALLGDLVRTIDIEDNIPSLFDFKEALNDYHKIDTNALKQFIVDNCTGETVGTAFRKLIRRRFGETLPEKFKDKKIKLGRVEGIGDVIMATAYVRRVAETMTESKVQFFTGEKCVELMQNTFKDLNNVEVMEGEYLAGVREISYNESWIKEIHAVEGMSGNVDEVCCHVNRVPKGNRKKPRVGIMPYMNKGAIKKIKEWPKARWKKLISQLRKEGYSIHQLGHTSDELVGRLKDDRKDTLQEIVDMFDTMDYVIAIEGLAGHIGKAINKPILVIQGNSSRHWHTSYEMHDHVLSNNECMCLASISPEYKKPCKIECMSSIAVKRVMTEFTNHVWKLSKDELS